MKMRPIVSRLSFVSSPMRTGGRSSMDAVSPESGDKPLRSMRRTRRTLRVHLVHGTQRFGVPLHLQLLGRPGVGDDARARRRRQGSLVAAELAQRERAAVPAEI